MASGVCLRPLLAALNFARVSALHTRGVASRFLTLAGKDDAGFYGHDMRVLAMRAKNPENDQPSILEPIQLTAA